MRQPNSIDFLKACGRAVIDSHEDGDDMGTVVKKALVSVAKDLRIHIDDADAEESAREAHKPVDDKTTVQGEGREV